MPEQSGAQLKIIYIAGAPHCGSTFMDLLLGESGSCLSTGQLTDLGHFILPDGSINSAKLDSENLPMWKAILDALEVEQRIDLRKHFALVHHEKSIVRFLFSRRFRRRYCEAWKPVLAAIKGGAPSVKAVVDSSKYTSRAVAFKELDGYDVFVVHLIRNGRGYISSKAKRQPHRISILWIPLYTLYWTLRNLNAAIILPIFFKDRFLSIRYEDFIASPRAEIGRIASATGLTLDEQFLANIESLEVRGKELAGGNIIKKSSKMTLDPGHLERNRLSRAREIIYLLSGGFIEKIWRY